MNSPFKQPISPISKNFVSPFPSNSHLEPPKIIPGPMGTSKWKFAASQLQSQLDEPQQRRDGQEN